MIWRRTLDFHWERNALVPSSITVREEDGFWHIFVGECPTVLRYASEQGAKLDAWQLLLSKRVAFFGTKRVRLLASQPCD